MFGSSWDEMFIDFWFVYIVCLVCFVFFFFFLHQYHLRYFTLNLSYNASGQWRVASANRAASEDRTASWRPCVQRWQLAAGAAAAPVAPDERNCTAARSRSRSGRELAADRSGRWWCISEFGWGRLISLAESLCTVFLLSGGKFFVWDLGRGEHNSL